MWGYARVNESNLTDDTMVTMNQREYEGYLEEKDVLLTCFSSQSKGFFSKLDKGIDSLDQYHRDTNLNDTNLKRYNLLKMIN